MAFSVGHRREAGDEIHRVTADGGLTWICVSSYP